MKTIVLLSSVYWTLTAANAFTGQSFPSRIPIGETLTLDEFRFAEKI